MKRFTLLVVSCMLLSIAGFAQSSAADSLARLKKEKEMLKMQERISQYKIDSVTLELDLKEKREDLHKLKLESQDLADKNYQHAQNLQRDAHSKAATRRADKAASAARKAAKKVRKAESSVDKTEKKLNKLKKNLSRAENKLKELTVPEE